MSTSTLALVLLAVMLVGYIFDRIPAVLITLCGLLAMIVSGILTPERAFSGFGSSAVILIASMNVIGAAFFTTGIADGIGRYLYRHGHVCERSFTLLCCTLSSVFSLFINATAVVYIFMPIIDSVAAQSNGRIRRKIVYLPCAISAVYGCIMTSVSSSCMVTANGLLQEATGQSIRFFQPVLLTGAGFVAMFIMLATFGISLMKRFFDFEEPPFPSAACTGTCTATKRVDAPKALTLIAVLICVIYGFVFSSLNPAVIALVAVCMLLVTKCISIDSAVKRINWITVITQAAGIGIGYGLSDSGAADTIALGIVHMIGSSPFILCAACMVIAALLSEFMANASAAVIVVPIAISFAQAIGVDVLPFVLATACGANYAVSTILSTACVAATAPIGYRFKDFLLWGGIVNVVALLFGMISLKLFFF